MARSSFWLSFIKIQMFRRLTVTGFAEQSLNFENAVSGCPVCCPARASLLTGQSPLTHGVIVNDVSLSQSSPFMGKLFADQRNYETAYMSDGMSMGMVVQIIFHANVVEVLTIGRF